MSAPQATTAARPETHTFAVFLLTGGVAAAVNLAARYLLSHWMVFEVAVTIAYLLGMTTAFLLSRRFVFASAGGSRLAQYGRFAMVNLFAFAQVLFVSDVLVRVVFPALSFHWYAQEVGHLVGVLSPVVTSYYAHKHFSFRGEAGKSRP